MSESGLLLGAWVCERTRSHVASRPAEERTKHICSNWKGGPGDSIRHVLLIASTSVFSAGGRGRGRPHPAPPLPLPCLALPVQAPAQRIADKVIRMSCCPSPTHTNTHTHTNSHSLSRSKRRPHSSKRLFVLGFFSTSPQPYAIALVYHPRFSMHSIHISAFCSLSLAPGRERRTLVTSLAPVSDQWQGELGDRRPQRTVALVWLADFPRCGYALRKLDRMAFQCL